MIAKISRGWRAEGLIRYLLGPGRFNEHVGQRVVATWDGAPETHQPARAADGSFAVRDLVDDLSAPAVAAGVALREPVAEQGERMPQGPVWHCSLRNSPEDPVLTDAQWAQVVEDLLDRTGIARRGDQDGCRWVAIRHADDHVHVAAMLVRQESGKRVHPYRDFVRARETCQTAEAELGLAVTAGVDRSSVTGPSQAEQEKAARRELSESPREWLRRMCRVAAVQARDPEAFVTALGELGVLVRPRYGTEGQDAVAGERNAPMVGYSVAAPGDITRAGQPVWFSGRTLARDLSLPKLVLRWNSAPAPVPASGAATQKHRATVSPQERVAAIDDAVSTMEHATATLAAGEAGASADGVAHAAGDMLAAVGAVTGRQDEGERVRRAASNDLDRATRVPGQVLPSRWSPVAKALRQSAWRLAATRTVGRHAEGDGARLVLALAALVAEIAALRETQARLAQARAAKRSCTALRSSVQATSTRATSNGPGRSQPRNSSRSRPQQPPPGPARAAKARQENETRGRGR
ncbi:relaxase/mobilization nuclease domain-containing protein [Pseudonocardia alni]|uniref:relaxase/mobilization nuclease domain-containing protein n=1 Tax=Pseudonocardia alni TaxID=33907 RepID=UPI00280B4CF5|nr:relaxase/mobilization nuclease domain-containing protein [Pseudonocardia alni]